MEQKRVLLISSVGGHLTQLLQLEPLFKNYHYHIVTEKSTITKELQNKYPLSLLVYGARNYPIRYLFKFSLNILKTLVIFLKKRPYVINTTGTHKAVPMCYFANHFRINITLINHH